MAPWVTQFSIALDKATSTPNVEFNRRALAEMAEAAKDKGRAIRRVEGERTVTFNLVDTKFETILRSVTMLRMETFYGSSFSVDN